MKCLLSVVGVLTAAWAPFGYAADDPRIRVVEYGQGGLIGIATSPDTTQTVLFAPGERVQSVVVSDPGAYQVSVAGAGDSLTLRANGPSALAVLSVRTDRRSYELELVPGQGAAPVVRLSASRALTISAARQISGPPTQASAYVWRIRGAKALRPLSVRDDGAKIYLEWRKEQPMPAVFAIDATGREEMVDSYMRDGFLTVDHVHRRLLFRIDKAKATAERRERRKSDG